MKAREFWIDPEQLDDDCYVHDAFSKHPQQGPLQWQSSLIHVIEYSAYEQSQKRVEVLERVTKQYYEYFKGIQSGEYDGSRRPSPLRIYEIVLQEDAAEALGEVGE